MEVDVTTLNKEEEITMLVCGMVVDEGMETAKD
jgi:hypothetical protein